MFCCPQFCVGVLCLVSLLCALDINGWFAFNQGVHALAHGLPDWLLEYSHGCACACKHTHTYKMGSYYFINTHIYFLLT